MTFYDSFKNTICKAFSSFWKWYSSKLVHSVTITLIVHLLQIPHFIWAGDVYLRIGMISYINPVIDFLLYGIDLIELPSLFNVLLLWLYHVKNKKTFTKPT